MLSSWRPSFWEAQVRQVSIPLAGLAGVVEIYAFPSPKCAGTPPELSSESFFFKIVREALQ
jgi:hypothetical protein